MEPICSNAMEIPAFSETVCAACRARLLLVPRLSYFWRQRDERLTDVAAVIVRGRNWLMYRDIPRAPVFCHTRPAIHKA
jgi:hypothetical protein